jgi:hypothetical protein
VYCPRALAGISRLHSILADRCIKVFLKRKAPDQKVHRLIMRRLAPKLQQLRDELHIFALQLAPAVAGHYERLDSLRISAKLDDRARDVLEPLFAIARVVDDADPEAHLTDQLVAASERIARDRADDEGEDELLTAVLEVLVRSFPADKDEWVLTSAAAVETFKRHENLDWMQKASQARVFLRRLGFRSSTHRLGKRVWRGYKIRKQSLVEMCKSYGVRAHD